MQKQGMHTKASNLRLVLKNSEAECVKADLILHWPSSKWFTTYLFASIATLFY